LGGDAWDTFSNGSSASLTEVEILVPVAVQTCGQVPRYHWRFGGVTIDSFDDVSVETVYELRKVRVPKDATACKLQAGASVYVCWKDPRDFPKKKRSGMPSDDPADGPPASMPQDDEWKPVVTTPVQDGEDNGRFIRPLSEHPWLGLGTGTPFELYGLTGTIGTARIDCAWDGLMIFPATAVGEVGIDDRARIFSVGFLSGIGDVRFMRAEWEGTQQIRIIGTDLLGRPVDEVVPRDLTFEWMGVELCHPLAMAEIYHSQDWSWRVDARVGIGYGILTAEADAATSTLGPAAGEQSAREATGFVSGSLQTELRYRTNWSVTARVEWINNFNLSGGADLTDLLSLEVGLEWRW
jgi:hypothetical protein